VIEVKNRRFDLPDHYYVYGLARPDGQWFYIGKGKRDRILQHFRSEEMGKPSYKTRVISKYGKDNIHKEIFAYFESEDEAYELEEFIIAQIGLENLTNVIPSRYEVGETSRGWEGWQKFIENQKKYSDDLIVECYKQYFEGGEPPTRISERTGIPRDYLNKVFKGKCRKDLFKEWILSGKIRDLFPDRTVIVDSTRKIVDEDLVSLYPKVVSGELSVREASELLGVHQSWLSAIYRGTKRSYLGFDISKDRVMNSKTYQRQLRKKKISWFVDQGFTPTQISKITGHSRSYVIGVCKELLNGT